MIQAAAIQITPEILGLVASIDEFKGACRALGTLAPDRLSALLRVATIESIGSSTRIEGSRLSTRTDRGHGRPCSDRASIGKARKIPPCDIRARCYGDALD